MKIKSLFSIIFILITVMLHSEEFFSEETKEIAGNGSEINIRSNVPKAYVYINGELQGRTELKIRNLREGLYSIKLVKKGFTDKVFEVTVKKGLALNFYAEMEEINHADDAPVNETPLDSAPEKDSLLNTDETVTDSSFVNSETSL